MARIVFTTFGSWGDLFPMVPVAKRLREAGHDVVFATTPAGEQIVGVEGFEFAPVGPRLGPEEYARHPEILTSRFRGVAGLVKLLRVFALPHLRDCVRDLDQSCGKSDLLVSHPVQLAARIVAERTSLPWATMSVFPALLRSRLTTPQPFAHRRVPPHANAVLWSLGAAGARLLFDREVNAVRREWGLPAVRDAAFGSTRSELLTLVLSSPHYTPVAPDWPDTVRLTGFTQWDTPSDWREPEGLARFLAAGPAPVIVTLGASVSIDPDGFFDRCRAALAAVGQRGLFLVGHEFNASGEQDDVWPFVPLSHVLPRAAAMVHAGGFGTTTAAILHGRPSVVVPRAFDQFHHADRVRELGLGTTLRWNGLTTGSLAKAIDRVIADPRYAQRAAGMARAVAGEDGPGQAAKELEALL